MSPNLALLLRSLGAVVPRLRQALRHRQHETLTKSKLLRVLRLDGGEPMRTGAARHGRHHAPRTRPLFDRGKRRRHRVCL